MAVIHALLSVACFVLYEHMEMHGSFVESGGGAWNL